MRYLAKAAAAGALLAAATSSASAIEVWQGHLFITAANAACDTAGWRVHQFFNAVYRPASLSDNGNSTLLALFGDRTAMSFAVSGALSGSGTYVGSRITPSANAFSWNGNYSQAAVGPKSVSATTKTVTVKVRLAKFANSGNCTVLLQGSLGKRPDL